MLGEKVGQEEGDDAGGWMKLGQSKDAETEVGKEREKNR